jgi:hypothetical protein
LYVYQAIRGPAMQKPTVAVSTLRPTAGGGDESCRCGPRANRGRGLRSSDAALRLDGWKAEMRCVVRVDGALLPPCCVSEIFAKQDTAPRTVVPERAAEPEQDDPRNQEQAAEQRTHPRMAGPLTTGPALKSAPIVWAYEFRSHVDASALLHRQSR